MRKIIFAAGMMSLLAACGNTGNTQTIAVDDTQNYDERKADSLGIPKGNKLSAAMKRAMKCIGTIKKPFKSPTSYCSQIFK